MRYAITAALIMACGSVSPALSAPALEDYGKDPAMDLARLSPSGERYAYVGAQAGHRQLFVYTVAGEPVKAVDLGPGVASGVNWAGDDHLVVSVQYTRHPVGQPDSFKVTQVLVINLASGKQFWVFEPGSGDKALQAVYGDYGAVRLNGRWMGYFGGWGYLGLSIYRVDLDTGEATELDHSRTGYSANWVINPEGGIAARSEYDADKARWRAFSRGAGTAGERLLAQNDSDPFRGSNLVGLGRTPGTILYTTVDDRKAVHWFEASSAPGVSPVELLGQKDVTRLYFDRQSMLFLGAQLYGPKLETVLFDAKVDAGFAAVEKAFAGRSLTLRSWNKDFSRLIIQTNGDHDAGTYWLVDLATGRADVLGDVWADIQDKDVNASMLFQYKATDGLPLDGVLTLPNGRDPKGLALLVMPHGGPTETDVVGFDWRAQAFARLGYAVFQPNYRGSIGHGEAFRMASNGEWGRKMQTDVSDGVAALAAQGTIDPRRVCIMGLDYGGYVALAGVTVQQGLYRCAVSVAGISNLTRFLQSKGQYDKTNPTGRFWSSYFGLKGPNTDTSDVVQSVSPVRLAAKADAPVLLIHDKEDSGIPISWSYEMKALLEKAGKPVEMAVIPGDDQGLTSQEGRTAMLQAAATFLQKYNPPNQVSPARP